MPLKSLTVVHPFAVSTGVIHSEITWNRLDRGAWVILYNWNVIVPDGLTTATLILLILTAVLKNCDNGIVIVPPLSVSIDPIIPAAFGTVIAVEIYFHYCIITQ